MLNVLIAEDEEYAGLAYRVALERKGHTVELVDNGEDCIKLYQQKLVKIRESENHSEGTLKTVGLNRSVIFDAVVLDYRMPRKDGMAVAKEILGMNPKQRLIFASAYVKDTLVDSVKQLNQVVELLQKPFEVEHLVDTIEDKEIYRGLERLNINIKELRGMDPTHEQIRSLLEGLRKLQKAKTF